MTKRQKSLLEAYNKGYRIEKDGEAYSMHGQLNVNYDSHGYKVFYVGIGERRTSKVYYHRLVAYQKYGNEIFKKGMVCRHLNGNKLDNSFDNIAIGTQRDNAFDRPQEERISHAILASNNTRRFSDEEMKLLKEFYQKTKSYKLTMEKFNISSKGTLYNMLNKEYVTKK